MKLYQRVIAGGLVIALSVGGTFLYANSNKADAEEPVIANSGNLMEKETKQLPVKTQSNLEIEKKEVVYIFAGADGEKQKILVTDTIFNPDAESVLEDQSNLENIINAKGDEEFHMDGKNLTWQADGRDICYQGTIQQDAPVSVKITYYLDGKEISASELAGKSGKVTIRFDYANRLTADAVVEGETKKVTVPFAMISAVLLDSDKFTNIEVTNGSLISEGNINAAILIGLPGVAQSLGLDEEYAMDYAEITADMVDFSLMNTFTVATNRIFANLGLEDDMDFDLGSLSDSLKRLGDATEELVDGTADLYDGVGRLEDGVLAFVDGVSDLFDGAALLSDNMGVLSHGAKELAEGTEVLADSLKQFQDGVKSAKDGGEALRDGLSGLKSGAGSFQDGIAAADAGIAQLAAGSGDLKNGAAQVQEGAKGLKEGVDSLNAGLAGLEDGLDTAYASLNATIAYNEQVLDGLGQIYQAYGEMLDPNTKESLQTMIGTLAQTIGAQKTIAASMAENGALKDGVTQLVAGADQLASGVAALAAGSSSVAEGAKSLDDGIGQLAGSMPQLTEGYAAIMEGIEQLNTGAIALDNGLTKLLSASGQLSNGGMELHHGAVELKDGAEALEEGSKALYGGAGELKDGTKALKDGVGELKDGSKALKDGMKEYSEEGIRKLMDALDGDLEKVYGNLKAMVEAAANYKSFTGISEGMEGNVTFIIRTEEVK